MNILKNLNIKLALKISLLVGILLVSTSLSYYYVVILPKIEEAKIQQEKPVKLIKEANLSIPANKQPIPSKLPIIPKKVLNPTPVPTKNTELEIEKCRTRLSDGLEITDYDLINNVIRQIYAPQFKELKEREEKGISLLLDCLNGENGSSDSGRALCQMITDSLDGEKKALEKESMDNLQQMIKNKQLQNYQDCLNSI
jgi:hypothetical protein